MDDYHEFDEEDNALEEAIEKIVKVTNRLKSQVNQLQAQDAPALRNMIEAEIAKGKRLIKDVKSKVLQNSGPNAAERKTDYIDAVKAFNAVANSMHQIQNEDDSAIVDEEDSRRGRPTTQLNLIEVESQDVDAMMEEENRQDAIKLAQDAAKLKEVAEDVTEMLGVRT